MSSTSTASRAQRGRLQALERMIPPVLRPLVRAYILGYVSAIVPRLLTLVLTYLGRKRKHDEHAEVNFVSAALKILRGGFDLRRFPTFCAALVGGSSLLEVPLRTVISKLAQETPQWLLQRLSTCISTFTAAWFSILLLQSKKSDAFVQIDAHTTATGVELRPIRFAGRTMDLTLFAVTRALDVLVGELWAQRRARKMAAGTWHAADRAVSALTDSSIFATSSALIMWAWIYSPDRLPRAYNKWIKSAAAVDERLLTALRRLRYGEMVYGLETGQAHVLGDMAHDYSWPVEWGDPAKSIPFPCEMVHMGVGPNCERHAVSRFARSFIWAFSNYLPLNLILTIRNPSVRGLKHALESSVRSSAFLGAFIALYYYGICLGRTRGGPRIIGTDVKARNRIDGGFCVSVGCSLCGWSILLENAARRKDIGLFVAPRALATLLPRRYRWEHQWRESLAFAVSTAIVFTCVAEKPQRVRGLLGKFLQQVMKKE